MKNGRYLKQPIESNNLLSRNYHSKIYMSKVAKGNESLRDWLGICRFDAELDGEIAMNTSVNDVKEIAENIKNIIDSRVAWVTEQQRSWEHKYNELKDDIKRLHENAQSNYDYVKTNNLSANMIETEGYLRAAKDMMTFIEDDAD